VLVTDMPLYRQLGFAPERTPHAAEAAEALISLPLSAGLTDDEVDRVIAAVREALAR
jgi:dTDP-4-amino-4,6-dideoxygalactose transaminase